jgi:hypothetical protein
MRFKRKSWALVEIGLACMLLAGAVAAGGRQAVAMPGAAQSAGSPPTTLVSDTVYSADGTPASGTLLVSWPGFVTAAGTNVPAGSTATTLGAGGALRIALIPNAGSTPMGSYYTVVYHLSDGTSTRQYWVVPVLPAGGAGSVTVSTISSTVLPASVAMQTVSKAYVDTAIAVAVAGHPLDSSPYVVKTGDTMTGPLVLPGDPTSPLQASEKQYVDEQVAGVAAGLGQKVSTLPQATQVVAQPTGTTLAVNRLNGAEYASQFVNGAGNNGIANTLATTDCTSGCDVVVEHSYHSPEKVQAVNLTTTSRVEDRRNGRVAVTTLDPLNSDNPGDNSGNALDVISTRSAPALYALNGAGEQFATTLALNMHALGGGSNAFPQNLQSTVPYFKTTYTALSALGTNNAMGQHILERSDQNCYGVGDCLMGSMTLTGSGGFRDDADEGEHPFDLKYREDTYVFAGICGSGCSTGSTSLTVNATAAQGTQGEGRYLMVTTPSKVLTGGSLIGGSLGPMLQQATFSGTNFPVSTLLESAITITSQANNLAPGSVTVPIVTVSPPAGYASNTAALPASSGVACIAGQQAAGGSVIDFESATYTVVDGSHLQMNLIRDHPNGATIAVGGLCGYGLEQTVDTTQGIRQVFPVVASLSPTLLGYAAGLTPLIGTANSDSAFVNLNLVIASIARTGNVVTVTTVNSFPVDIAGLTMQVQGVSDSGYNGSFVVTTTSSNSLTYQQTGANSTSSGGTLSLLTGGYALYPMAEVLSVYNPSTKAVDGQMTLAANTVNWASGDTVEQPHYFQNKVAADVSFVTQYTPRPPLDQQAGIRYEGNNGPGIYGWQILNATPASNYFGNGGTHSLPNTGIQVQGPWNDALELDAGANAAIQVHCNLHGCGKWNSGYNLLAMDSNNGEDTIAYSPTRSSLSYSLDGTAYYFTPQGFTAGTINVGSLNIGAIPGLFSNQKILSAALPVFGASGSAHQVGAVPDPGATVGVSRFLREDGTWSAPGGSSSTGDTSGSPVVTSASGYQTSGPIDLPSRSTLLGEYLLSEGSGTVAHDTSGQGNDAPIVGAPVWESTTDLNFEAGGGQYLSLPATLNGTRTWQFAIYQPAFVVQANGSASQPYPNWTANPSLLCGTTSNQLCLIENSMTSFKSMRFDAFNTDNTESAETLTAGWHIVTYECGSNVGGVVTKTHILYDGQEVGNYLYQGDAGTCPNPGSGAGSGNYQVGGSSILSGTWFTGRIAAVWAWNTALTVNQGSAAAAAALAFIRSKGVPSGYRPVTYQTPTIVAGLDSRTSGVQLSGSSVWPAMMHLTDSTYQVINLGTPGVSAFDACAGFDLSFGLQLSPNSGPAIVMLWGGVNDYVTQTPRQIANNLRCMVQKAKQHGARVVLATEISALSNTGTADDLLKDQLDVILRGEAFGWGVDNLADLATDTHLGPDGASSNTACFPDNLHPGPGCEPYVTAIMQNAANELLGASAGSRHQNGAATYQELAGDRFLDLTGSSAQSVSLPDCTGYSLPREISNLGSNAATVATINSQSLTGSGSVAAGARGTFLPVPGAPASGGCRWERTQ